ncbi:MAG: hypothetical protein ACYDEC_07660 [Bacteroidia bacterium]
MNRNWNDFKALNGNIAGAREAFEDACETLFRKVYPDRHVSQVKVKVGDGGIDIFIGELGVDPIIVIQCKFFLDAFEEGQKSQIRDSFGTAITSDKYELLEWILCIPRVIDIDEYSWWFKWKHKKIEEYSKDKSFIKLINGNELIDLFKANDLYNQIFRIEDSIKISEIHQAVVPKKIDQSPSTNPQTVLFNNYSQKCEPYYLEREADKFFLNALKINNIWVFGNSGIGKTVLVNRNLTKNEIEYCFCDLSPVNITNSDQVIEEVICKTEEKFILERNPEINNKIKQLTHILCRSNRKEIIIVIDELSVKENNILKAIATDLMNLVVHYCNTNTDASLKFVVSTISNPKDILENHSKASEHFQYIDCNDWSNDIEKLFNTLSSSLNIKLEKSKESILKACENSPRILKSIFRKIVVIDNLSDEAIENTIKLTVSEFVR